MFYSVYLSVFSVFSVYFKYEVPVNEYSSLQSFEVSENVASKPFSLLSSIQSRPMQL